MSLEVGKLNPSVKMQLKSNIDLSFPACIKQKSII